VSDETLSRCRVCGYRNPDPPWGEDGVCPTSTYCPCCGVEFGYQDSSPQSARWFRDHWLAGGALWAAPGFRPVGWDLHGQLRHVPAAYR
jgi:hypothetical protein